MSQTSRAGACGRDAPASELWALGAGGCAAGNETLAVLRSAAGGGDELGYAPAQAVMAHVGEPE